MSDQAVLEFDPGQLTSAPASTAAAPVEFDPSEIKAAPIATSSEPKQSLAASAWEAAKKSFTTPFAQALNDALGKYGPAPGGHVTTLQEHYNNVVNVLKDSSLGRELIAPFKDVPGVEHVLSALEGVGRAGTGVGDFLTTPAGVGSAAGAALLPPAGQALVSAGYSAANTPAAYEATKEAIKNPTPENVGHAAESLAIVGAPELLRAIPKLAEIPKEALDRHNLEAERLVEEDRQAGLKADNPESATVFPVQVGRNTWTVETAPGFVGKSGEATPYVVRDQRGKIVSGGNGTVVADFLRQRGAAPADLPWSPPAGSGAPVVTPPAIVREGESPAATPAAPEGVKLSQEFTEGTTFEKPSGNISVTSVDAGKVRFDQTKPDGTTTQAVLPINIFRKFVSGAKIIQTGETKPEGPEFKPEELQPAPALRGEEVIQPKPSEQVAETAGAGEGESSAKTPDNISTELQTGPVAPQGVESTQAPSGPGTPVAAPGGPPDAEQPSPASNVLDFSRGKEKSAIKEARTAINRMKVDQSVDPQQIGEMEGYVSELEDTIRRGPQGNEEEYGNAIEASAAPLEEAINRTMRVASGELTPDQATEQAYWDQVGNKGQPEFNPEELTPAPAESSPSNPVEKLKVAPPAAEQQPAPKSALEQELERLRAENARLKGKKPAAAPVEQKQEAAAPERRDFSSTQFNLPSALGGAVGAFGKKIPKSDLAENGIETEPHITVKYGLHGNESAEVENALKGEGPVPVKLGKTSIFETPDADVLKIDVDSPELHALNAKVATLPHTDTHPDYKPHVTIAYLKKGTGAKYAGKAVPGVTGTSPILNVVTFSPASGEKSDIVLRQPRKLAPTNLGAKVTPQVPTGVQSGESKPAAPIQSGETAPLATEEKAPTISAGNERTATTGERETASTAEQPVRIPDNEALAGELSEGSEGAGESRPDAGSRRKGIGTRKPRARAGPEEGSELESGGGTVSGVVGDPAEPERTFPPRAQDVVSAHHDRDYRIPDGRVVSGSPETRARINIAAIRKLREIQEQNRPATVEEQEILAGYVGWGAVPQIFAGNTPEFQKLQEELKNLLKEEEYDSAARSTTNAHYTGDNIVDALWKTMQTLGAKAGMSWLEPAVGVGNFFGRQPQELLEGARRVGLDKDELTGQIAKLLYPDSGIDTVAFEDAELPEDYFDGAISNVPFGNFGVHDAKFKGKPFLTGSIHNYFFAKSLTMVRPGGIVGFVTSRYTMDAYEAGHVNFRRWVSQQADFLGAVRLPSGAFRQNAGTDVITDIIFLRRRLPDAAPAGEDWVASSRKMLQGPYGREPVNVNDYYSKHPEMVLGTEGLSRGQFSMNDYDVKGSVTQEALEEALKKIADVGGFQQAGAGKKSRKVAIRELNAPAEQSKLGGLFFDEKGGLFRKTSKGSAEPVDVADSAKARIRGQLAIRDVLAKLTAAELAGKPDAELNHLRKNLNNVYDQFVKKNGPLSTQANTAVMKGDPDAPLLISLERKFGKGNKSQGRAASVEKAPIFNRRMLKPPEVPTSVNDPKDAMYITLNERGRLDWDRMGELTGKAPEQLQQDLAGLVYQDPKTRIWQTAEEYLSGSVRNKLKEARAITKIEPQFKENAEALEKVQPEDIPQGEISALLGVTWVPIDTYSQFAAEMLGAENPERVKVKYAGGNWLVDPGWGNRLTNSEKWKTARATAVDLLNDTLNLRRTKIYDRDSDGTSSVNPDETKAARSKQMEMQEHFDNWLFADTKRGDMLARIYNDTQNDLRLRTYDGSHLSLPEMTKDAAVVRGGDLDPHQKAAVWRQIVQPNVMLAHAVGAGKTFEMIAGGMELKRLGLIQRPMYVVPNATLTGWQQQFAALYPQKRVIVFSEKDLEKTNRQRVMAQIATGDWDAVVVPHSSFQFLPTGDEIFNEHYEKLKRDLESAIEESQSAGIDTRQIKRMEKAKERLLTNLKDRRNAEKKDQTVSWEQLGIDQLYVDESHCFEHDTPVLTDRGWMAIGDVVDSGLNVQVLSMNLDTETLEWKEITGWFRNSRHHPIVRVHHEHGFFECTSNHSIWTESGYVEAANLTPRHSLRMVHGNVPTSETNKPILQRSLQDASSDIAAGVEQRLDEGASRSIQEGTERPNRLRTHAVSQPDVESGDRRKDAEVEIGENFSFARRQRYTDEAAGDACGATAVPDGTRDHHESSEASLRESTELLQGGSGAHRDTYSNRGGWNDAQDAAMALPGQAQDLSTRSARVVRVEIQERGSLGGCGIRSFANPPVYCLQVEDNNNFFAAGILVSNSYKKLGFATKQGNVSGIDQQGNQMTFDLTMKMRHTQKHGRGVVFATGTPVTNTMGELYSIMRYLIEPELEARGMGKFDEWAANYGRTVDVFEPKVEGGGYQLKARFAEFVNLPELATLFRSFADVVTSDMVKLPRPELIGGDRQAVLTELSPEQEDYLQHLRKRADNIRKDPRKAMPDNMLAVYTDAAKMAMDIRMVRPWAPDEKSGRMDAAADKIYEYWKESAKNKGTQLVVSDMGKPEEAGGSKEFSAYDDLIDKLVDRGIPRQQIAHIYQAKNKAQRARMFHDVNDGKIRVLLGSTMKVGVGVNIQQRLYALHHLDIPHRPSDLEQREGRILRQGNENPAVHIAYYMTRGSLDEAKFANVTRKAKFINQVLQGKAGVRKAEDVGGMVASLGMFQAMTSGDPRVMRKMEIDAEVDRLAGVLSGWKNQQYKIRSDLQRIPWRISNAEKRIATARRDIAVRDKTGDKWAVGKKTFSGEDSAKDFNAAIEKEAIKIGAKQLEDVNVGSARGLPITASYSRQFGDKEFIRFEIGDTVSRFEINRKDFEGDHHPDFHRRLENQLRDLERDATGAEMDIERAKKDGAALQSGIEERWRYAEKLQDLVEEQRKLVKELGSNKGDEDAAAAVGEGGEIADTSVQAEEGEPAEDEDEEDDSKEPLGLSERKKGERGSVSLPSPRLEQRLSHIASPASQTRQAIGGHKNAVEALQSAMDEVSDKGFGEKIRTFVTGERDIRVADTNQLREDLQKFIPDHLDQEALTLLRDFKSRPGELEEFLNGTHEAYDSLPPDERTEAIERVQKLAPAIERALHPTAELLGADQYLTHFFKEHLDEGRKLGFLDSNIPNEEYITHLLQPGEQGERKSRVGELFRGRLGPKRFRFSKQRAYPTVLHALANGARLRSLNALDALGVYGEKFATTAAYHLLLRVLKSSAAGKWGSYGQQRTGTIPADWVELAPESRIFRQEVPFLTDSGEPQVAHQTLFVPPKIEEALRPIIDPNYMTRVPGFEKSLAYQSYIKTVELGLSVFHLKALNLTAMGNEELSHIVGTWLTDMESEQFKDLEKIAVRAGLQTPVLDKTAEVYKALRPSSLPTLGEKIRDLPVLKQIDAASAAISHLTFGIVQRKYKVIDFALKSAAWMASNPEATPEAEFEAQRQIAKQVNATYGGLHWENLNINRMTRQLSRALMLAPDWTYSNVLNLRYAGEGGPGGKAARLFWMRSLIWGLALTAATSLLLSGKLSKDPTRVSLGNDKDGRPIDDNIFFVGAPGDASTLIHNVYKFGAPVGTARTIFSKLGPFARTAVHMGTNQDARGRQIIPSKTKQDWLGRDVGAHETTAVEKNVLGVKEAGRELLPVPFSVTSIANMLIDPDHHYKLSQYLEAALSGRQPQSVEGPDHKRRSH